jgi:hypothetical protein
MHDTPLIIWPGPWSLAPDAVTPKRSRLKDRPAVMRREPDGALLVPVRYKGWHYAIISAEDAWATKWCWFATPELYVWANMDNKCKYLHRAVAFTALNNLPACPPNFFLHSGTQVDHKDRNPLSNMRDNLRGVSNSVNNQNRTPGVTPPGVCWDNARNMWLVRVKWRGVAHYGGRFASVDDAAAAAESLRTRICKRYRKSYAKVQHLTAKESS